MSWSVPSWPGGITRTSKAWSEFSSTFSRCARIYPGTRRFGKLVQRTKHGALSAMAHQDWPFEKLVEELQVERDLSRAPLFQMLFILHNTPGAELALDGLMVSRVAHEAVFTPYDLVLDCTETADGLVGALT